MRTGVVLRRPEARRFIVLRSARAGAVVDALESRWRVLVSDLALGPAGPHHVAHELAGQLSVALSRPKREGADSDSAQNIERESRGDPVRLAALAHAERLAAVLDVDAHHLVIIGPRFGLSWGEANLALLRFAADVLAAEQPRITLILDDADGEPESPLGLYSPRDAARSSRRRASFVDPALAARPGLVPEDAQSKREGVAAFTTKLGVRFVEPGQRRLDIGALPRRAPSPFSGDDGFALQVAERRHENTRSVRDLYRLQRARLQACAFEAAAAQPLDFAAPESLRREILGTIGYAAAMRGDPALACSLLEALSPGAGPGTSPDLYLRNTYALALARSRCFRRALAIELGVCDALATRPRAWHLRVVNLLNLARLHRSLGWTRKARLSFLAWERAMRGHMIEAEFLQCGAALARVAEALGHHREAFRRWFRVALHWVAHPRPETLSWRATSALVGAARERCEVDEVCAVLAEQLSRAARRLGIRAPLLSEAVTFTYARHASSGWSCVAGSGFAVLANDRTLPPVYDSAAHHGLRAALGALLRATVGAHAAAASYGLDAAHGYDMPATLEEARDSAARYRAERWITAHGAERLPSSAVGREARIRRSEAIDALTRSSGRLRVTYKRHWAPVQLSAPCGELLGAVLSRTHARSEAPQHVLQELEALRVVRVSSER